MRAIVVGGGIGGLAAAVALRRHGWQVEILERASTFTEVGAGISLWPNALRALDTLGLGGSVRERAAMGGQAGVMDPAGRWLANTDTAELERRYGPTYMLHRADLLNVLHGAVPSEALHGDTEVTRVGADGAVVHSTGESAADLVVGADGIRSAVRRSILPTAPRPRYVGYATWRMVTDPVSTGGVVESWGRGERFGYAPLPDGRIYGFAVANAPPDSARGGLAEIRRRFGGWHEPIPSILDAARVDAVLHHDLYELPPIPAYVSGKVALLGDAAHAMTPNLGQGACQALEDAVVLADAVEGGAGLAAYDRLRRPRTQMIARQSRRIGAMAQAASPIAVTLRDAAARLMPSSAFVRTLKPILDWTPSQRLPPPQRP